MVLAALAVPMPMVPEAADWIATAVDVALPWTVTVPELFPTVTAVELVLPMPTVPLESTVVAVLLWMAVEPPVAEEPVPILTLVVPAALRKPTSMVCVPPLLALVVPSEMVWARVPVEAVPMLIAPAVTLPVPVLRVMDPAEPLVLMVVMAMLPPLPVATPLVRAMPPVPACSVAAEVDV